jgi:PKD repeat protein
MSDRRSPQRSRAAICVLVVVGLLVGLVGGVTDRVIQPTGEALAVPAPLTPFPECAVAANGTRGLGCVPDDVVSPVADGNFAAGGSFTINAQRGGVAPCLTHVSTGCYYSLSAPSIGRCVYLNNNDPFDVRACSGSLSTQGSVSSGSAQRQGSCSGALGSVYVYGGPATDPSTWWNARAARLSACEFRVPDTRPVDNLLGPTFILVSTSVRECLAQTGFGCDEPSATLVTRTEWGWLPVAGELAPRASFTVAEADAAGQFTFTNTSVPFRDGASTYEWNFGDGSPIDTSVSPTHTFTTPGNKTVRLTMRGAAPGQSRSASATVEVEELELEVTVVNPEARFGPGETGNRHAMGDEFPVVVRLAANNGVGTLTDVAARDGELFADLPDQLEVVEADDLGDVPSEILPESVYTLRATMRAVGAGRFTLPSTWDGLYNGTDAVEFVGVHEGSVTGLSVEVVVDPAKVEQDESDDDEPVPVNVEVRIENTSEGDITNLTLRALGLERRRVGQGVDYDWLDPEVDPPPPPGGLVVEMLPGPDPKALPFDSISGLALPDIPQGETVVVKAKVMVNDDGVFDVKASVQAMSPSGGTMVGTGETKLEVDPEFYLKFESEVLRPLPGTLVPAGETIRIKGSIENVTTTSSIEIGTPYPTTSGNAGEMVATWNPTSDTDSSPAAPLETVVLEPGERIEFLVRINTGASDPRPGRAVNPSGGTRANIEFTPWGIATLEDGTEVDVVDDLIDSVDEQLDFSVSIDDSIELPETDELALSSAIFLGGIEGAVNSVVALIQGIIETPEMIHTALRATAEYQTKIWNSFSEEEKADFLDSSAQLVASVLYRNVEFARRDAPELYNQAYAAVGTLMTDLATEWETGDYLSTAQKYAAAGGEAIGSVALPIALTKLAKSPQAAGLLERWQVGRQARLAEVQGEIAAIEKVQDAGRLLRVIEAGLELTPDQIAKLYGIGPDDAAELLRFAEKYELLITVRSRHATSLQWIERFGAMFKPEALKVKSVSDLDLQLGYPEERLGSLVFKKPEVMVLFGDTPTEVQISNWVVSKGFTPNTPEYWNAMGRVALRKDEWKKYEQTYRQWSERGWIETTFDFEGNNAAAVNFSTDKKFNGFRMQRLSPEGDPNELYALQLFDAKKGKWVPITGDIDPIAFTKLDGSPISSEVHKALLEEMIKSPQLRAIHGETATFTKTIRNAEGNIVKKLGGLDLIEDQFKPGEAAIQFAPGAAPRTVRFDKSKSRWDTPFDFDLHWEGGFVQASKPKATVAQSSDLGISLINGRPPVPAPPVKDLGIPKPPRNSSDPNYGRCRIDSGGVPNGAVISGADGALVGVGTDGSTTRLTDLKFQCFSEGLDVIPVATGVVTAVGAGSGSASPLVAALLTSDVSALAAGSTTITVADVSGLVVGDIAALSPGTAQSELVQIVAISGNVISLAAPTRHLHAEEALFAVVDRVRPIVAPPVAPPAAGTGYGSLVPARLFDSRGPGLTVDGLLSGGGRVAAGSVTEVPVAGRGGVPGVGGVGAVVLNVTVVDAGAAGFVTVLPCGGEVPNSSNLNFVAGQTIPNAVVSKVGAGGSVCVFSSAEAHLLVDVNGAFPAVSDYGSLVPARLFDSRGPGLTVDGLLSGGGRVAAGSVTEVPVAGRGGVPGVGGVGAVVLNVTVVDAGAAGFVTVLPCGGEVPNSSNLNFVAGQTIPNAVVSKVGAGGSVCVFSSAEAHLLVDVNGAFPAVSDYGSLVPARLFDSRGPGLTVDGLLSGGGRVAAGSVTEVPVAGRGGVPGVGVPGGVGAVVLNVTVVDAGAAGFVTVLPCGGEVPNSSNLNFVAGQTIPNAVVSKVGAGGSVCVFSSAEAHLLVDVNGAFPAN